MAKAKRPFPQPKQPISTGDIMNPEEQQDGEQPKDETLIEPTGENETPVTDNQEPEEAPVATEAPSEAPVEAPVEAPTDAPTEAPAVAEAPVEAPADTTVVTEPSEDISLTEEERYLVQISGNGTPLQKEILKAARTFVELTKPRMPITDKAGFEAQSAFLDWMLKVLDADPEEMRKAWQALLVFFKVFHGESNSPRGYTALSEYRAACFRDAWSDVDRLDAYSTLVTILRTTRNVETRKHDLKRIDFNKIPTAVIDGQRLENLKRFYGV